MAETPVAYVRGLSDAAKLAFDAFQQITGGGEQQTGARRALQNVHRQIIEARSNATDSGVIHTDVVLNETKLALAESERMVEIYKDAHADLRKMLPAKNDQIAWLLNWSLLATFIAITEFAVIVIYALKMKEWL